MALSDLLATKLHFAGTSLAGRALKMPLAIQKVLSNRVWVYVCVCVWEWTQLLPYLFCCPACSLIRLSCRRLTQSAINVNSKYGHQEPSSSISLSLSPSLALPLCPPFCLRFILFISLPECRLLHMVLRLRSLRNFCAWLRPKLSFLCGIYPRYLIYSVGKCK